ncbi:MAG: ABC transporter permease, partial [Marinobacter sp.]|nr:ABC transporter permease [Marinobacter sp.]
MSFRSLTPIQQRRLRNFRKNRRGFWSLWIFLALFGLSLVAELIANDSPLVVSYKGDLYFPVVQSVPEETFGG